MITGADLSNLGEQAFQKLREAVYTHNVAVLKDQGELLPAKQFEFVHRFDPDSNPKHGFGTGKGVKELGDLGVGQSLCTEFISVQTLMNVTWSYRKSRSITSLVQVE